MKKTKLVVKIKENNMEPELTVECVRKQIYKIMSENLFDNIDDEPIIDAIMED